MSYLDGYFNPTMLDSGTQFDAMPGGMQTDTQSLDPLNAAITAANNSGPMNLGQGNPATTPASGGFDWSSLSGLLGPAVSGLGAYLGNNQATNATNNAAGIAQQSANPYNVNINGYGQTAIDPTGRTAGVNPSGALQQFGQNGQYLSNLGFGGLQQGQTNPYGSSGYGNVSPQLSGQFNNYQNSPYNAPGANIYGSQQAYNGLMTQAGNTASGLFNQVGNNLPSTQGANNYLGAGQNFLNQATQFNVGDQSAQNLAALRSQAQFGDSQAQQNNIESQFGKGILASTAGGYQTQALNNSQQMADVQRQALAHQMAMQDQQGLLQNSIGASNSGYGYLQGIQGLQGGQLNQANSALQGYQNLQQTGFGQGFQNQNFGNMAANQMFGNAMNLFGTGMAANQQQFNQSNSLYNQGQQNNLSVGSYLQGLLGLGSGMGSNASGASGLAAQLLARQGTNTGNLTAGFGNSLGSMLAGPSSGASALTGGLGSLLGAGANYLGGLFGGGGGGSPISQAGNSAINAANNSGYFDASNLGGLFGGSGISDAGNSAIDAASSVPFDSGGSWLSDFSGASGQAATGTDSSGFQLPNYGVDMPPAPTINYDKSPTVSGLGATATNMLGGFLEKGTPFAPISTGAGLLKMLSDAIGGKGNPVSGALGMVAHPLTSLINAIGNNSQPNDPGFKYTPGMAQQDQLDFGSALGPGPQDPGMNLDGGLGLVSTALSNASAQAGQAKQQIDNYFNSPNNGLQSQLNKLSLAQWQQILGSQPS